MALLTRFSCSSRERGTSRASGNNDLHILRRSSFGSLMKGWEVVLDVADAILFYYVQYLYRSSYEVSMSILI